MLSMTAAVSIEDLELSVRSILFKFENITHYSARCRHITRSPIINLQKYLDIQKRIIETAG